jgi:hypothetical protein
MKPANDVDHDAEVPQGWMWRVQLIFIFLVIALPEQDPSMVFEELALSEGPSICHNLGGREWPKVLPHLLQSSSQNHAGARSSSPVSVRA